MLVPRPNTACLAWQAAEGRIIVAIQSVDRYLNGGNHTADTLEALKKEVQEILANRSKKVTHPRRARAASVGLGEKKRPAPFFNSSKTLGAAEKARTPRCSAASPRASPRPAPLLRSGAQGQTISGHAEQLRTLAQTWTDGEASTSRPKYDPPQYLLNRYKKEMAEKNRGERARMLLQLRARI